MAAHTRLRSGEMMKCSVAVLVLVATLVVPANAQAIAPAPPGEECAVAPTLLETITQPESDYHRTPGFVGGYVWFGESVYTPDGTVVAAAPPGFARGEVPHFVTDRLNTRTVTWGVVVDTESGVAVHSPTGSHRFDLPIDIHAEAVYAGGLILAADWSDVGGHLERVLLVKEDGTIVELTSAANGFGAFGTVADGTVYVALRDGGLATFDTDGHPGSVVSPGVQFTDVVTANSYIYAYSGGPAGSLGLDTTLHVFDRSGAQINETHLGGSAVRIGPTALGFAADVHSHGNEAGIAAVAMAPNGAGLTVLAGLHNGTVPKDSLAWQHGRYLIGMDTLAETEDGVATAQLNLYRLDGTLLTSSEAFDYRVWPSSQPAGRLLAFVGGDGQQVDIRSLSGTLLESIDYSGTTTPEIETIGTNDEYLWVTTTDAAQDLFTAHIYDLGECSGVPEPGTFLDDDWSIFENSIEWLAAQKITYGCNPGQANTRFCPDESLTRAQMAALLHRAVGDSVTPTGSPIRFTDTTHSIFREAIEWLSATGITRGCSATTFCPDDTVTRGQMAAFLTRALDLPRASDPDRFTDDDHSVFEGDIASLAAAGITSGCGPDRFCPEQPLTRAEMAAFLQRALDT